MVAYVPMVDAFANLDSLENSVRKEVTAHVIVTKCMLFTANTMKNSIQNLWMRYLKQLLTALFEETVIFMIWDHN